MSVVEGSVGEKISVLLTPAEVAEILRVKQTTVLQWARIGIITSVRFGHGGRNDPVRFRRRDIQRFIDGEPVLAESKHRKTRQS